MTPDLDPTPPPYLVGLRLQGRRVLVVGGGGVAQRRVPQLLAAGADVLLVSPEVTPALEGLAGELTWAPRPFEDADVDDAWYVLAATDDPAVNARVAELAEGARVFCVRADDARAATAWTPATGRHDGVSVAVLANRDPRLSAAVRDDVLDALRARRPDDTGDLGEDEAGVGVPGVTLVGGGPGDPELITLAGRRALMAADVVVADRLAPRELLGELSPDVELIDVAKLPRGRSTSQEEINRVIVEKARQGLRVARFKGGDSFVFGRGYEEVLACREAGIPVTVVPGVTSPIAVPGVTGLPVTHRGVAHEVTIVSGHLPPGHPESLTRWEALAGLRGTLVLMMAVENAPRIAEVLLAGGRDAATPVAVVCDGTMPGERTVLATLGTLAEELLAQQVRPPAIIVIGEVVAVAHPERFA
ncbi:uroporphyrinogen-III C-methyltransferase [Nocardioides sp. TRM66260-LWL]|uniref:uroporphyrinogen-III C-methyltransferase n=1 Tax=Nocardioides sp. TRM66260-LWL TaxID=2874478 RepID=UPI001CC6AEE7|nr:uroporphyrinogen-III C-methyltransferase [Nocardioides sp. TRM66260-LWL]MBZ5733938.1 uroporphyrinogen-III C-methyltransferase [Nocardioides sp. TRM66260-LWL]